ncbi:hypothetical protein VTH06DRAFT_2111, partial [Thermothelomyces fergusii]
AYTIIPERQGRAEGFFWQRQDVRPVQEDDDDGDTTATTGRHARARPGRRRPRRRHRRRRLAQAQEARRRRRRRRHRPGRPGRLGRPAGQGGAAAPLRGRPARGGRRRPVDPHGRVRRGPERHDCAGEPEEAAEGGGEAGGAERRQEV